MNVLFVCTGNTCRSPIAEGYLASLKLDGVKVESRGIAADGSPVSENSKIVAAEIGIDISRHISAQITADDIEKSDKIICISPNHFKFLLNAGVKREKLVLLSYYIGDPYGGHLNAYRSSRDHIITEINRLVNVGFFSNMAIDTAQIKDIKEIAELEKICFSPANWSEKTITDAYEKGVVFLVARINGEFAGYVGITLILDEGYIANIAVHPKHRQKGIAYLLLKRIDELAAEKGLSFVTLEVRASNTAAISLYSKYSYEEEGKRKGYYKNPTEDALIMTKRFI